MTLAKRPKTLLVVFFVGLSGLVVDRVLLGPQGGPRAASADSFALSNQAALLSDNLPVLEENFEKGGIAEDLNSLCPNPDGGMESRRNPFALPAPWQAQSQKSDAAHPDEASLFASRHRLTAVVVDNRVSYAIVNDDFLVPGQSLDGFRLVSVGDRSAVFEQGGKQVVLELVNP